MTNEDDDTMFGLTDEELDERFAAAVSLANEKKRIMGVPLPKYDFEQKKAYLLYADGRKEYVVAS